MHREHGRTGRDTHRRSPHGNTAGRTGPEHRRAHRREHSSGGPWREHRQVHPREHCRAGPAGTPSGGPPDLRRTDGTLSGGTARTTAADAVVGFERAIDGTPHRERQRLNPPINRTSDRRLAVRNLSGERRWTCAGQLRSGSWGPDARLRASTGTCRDDAGGGRRRALPRKRPRQVPCGDEPSRLDTRPETGGYVVVSHSRYIVAEPCGDTTDFSENPLNHARPGFLWGCTAPRVFVPLPPKRSSPRLGASDLRSMRCDPPGPLPIRVISTRGSTTWRRRGGIRNMVAGWRRATAAGASTPWRPVRARSASRCLPS